MARRLSEADRAQLEARREQLQLELRLIEGELRTERRCGYSRSCGLAPRLHHGRRRDWIE
jgi:hypothetical protein